MLKKLSRSTTFLLLRATAIDQILKSLPISENEFFSQQQFVLNFQRFDFPPLHDCDHHFLDWLKVNNDKFIMFFFFWVKWWNIRLIQFLLKGNIPLRGSIAEVYLNGCLNLCALELTLISAEQDRFRSCDGVKDLHYST